MRQDGKCFPLPGEYNIGNPKEAGEITVKVEEPTSFLDGVYVYEKGAFSRDSDDNDPNDWRWVIDFENDVYDVAVPKKKWKAVTPYVSINNGLFYTFHRTTSKFALHKVTDAPNIFYKQLSRVAQIIAANIYLKPRGSVNISFENLPGLVLAYPNKPNVTYEIYIRNDCRRSAKGCDYYHGGGSKQERNDFYLYYDTFEKPKGYPEVELFCVNPYSGGSIRGLCDEDIRAQARSTDEAPCGGATFSKSRGGG